MSFHRLAQGVAARAVERQDLRLNPLGQSGVHGVQHEPLAEPAGTYPSPVWRRSAPGSSRVRRLPSRHASPARPTVDLAARVGLSPTPCARRVKRLEDGGVIQGYAARINPSAMGLAICVIVSVRLGKQGPEGAGEFLREVAKRPEITECLLGPGTSTTCCVSGSRT
ncbi:MULTISPECIES: Lrp/AsnC family transcriptional regulator [Mesorhizobium]|uniref:Lrp/AsnC family transcriptional regulator n=1 Tax=Mesorhizobium TaxID=68287 RepID=UPI0009BE2D99|nr:Lrp/AsnC family transcriptional regulator [Mesorhizobium loti]